jgi:hypothetical protein
MAKLFVEDCYAGYLNRRATGRQSGATKSSFINYILNIKSYEHTNYSAQRC